MSIVFNLQHLQNYYDHHLHAIYVLVLSDWCHFMWNFPYGFIVHIFVFVNGSIPMCWAETVVSLTSSHSSPLSCLQFDCLVECISEKVLVGACGFSFPLCFLTSAHWAYVPRDGLARPERMHIPACLILAPLPRVGYLLLLSLEATPLLFVSCLWESGWTSLTLCSMCRGKRSDGNEPWAKNLASSPVSSIVIWLTSCQSLMVWWVRESLGQEEIPVRGMT